jgi:hypothetical protein
MRVSPSLGPGTHFGDRVLQAGQDRCCPIPGLTPFGPRPPYLAGPGPWLLSAPRASMVNTTQAAPGLASPSDQRRPDSGGNNGVPEKRLRMTLPLKGARGGRARSWPLSDTLGRQMQVPQSPGPRQGPGDHCEV